MYLLYGPAHKTGLYQCILSSMSSELNSRSMSTFSSAKWQPSIWYVDISCCLYSWLITVGNEYIFENIGLMVASLVQFKWYSCLKWGFGVWPIRLCQPCGTEWNVWNIERISDVAVDNLKGTDPLTGLPIAWSYATLLSNFIEFEISRDILQSPHAVLER